MTVDLASLAAPAHTAVLTVELQRGVVGDLATTEELATVVRQAGVVEAASRLVRAARAHGARVVHCTAQWRADRAGTALNTPLAAALARNPHQILEGTPAVDLVAGLGPEPGDLLSPRYHGLTPFTGTDLDARLRNCGVRTVVATGVSLNVGVLGMCLEAASLGYRVVVPTDAVAGVPPHYAAEVLHHTIGHIATLIAVDDLVSAWST